jgi:anti-sigma B factor antagonist
MLVMEPLQLKTDQDGAVIAVSAIGELDIATAGLLDEELRRVHELSPRLLVLDLRGLTFLDSTGIRTILAADARAQEDGAELKIVRGPEQVDRVFRLTGIGDRLDIVDEFSGRS